MKEFFRRFRRRPEIDQARKEQLERAQQLTEQLLKNIREVMPEEVTGIHASLSPAGKDDYNAVVSLEFAQPQGSLLYDVRPGRTGSYIETDVNHQSQIDLTQEALSSDITDIFIQGLRTFHEEHQTTGRQFHLSFSPDFEQEEELAGGYQLKYPVTKWIFRFIITHSA